MSPETESEVTSINSLVVEKSDGLIKWRLGMEPISISLKDIDQAILNKVSNIVLVLTGPNGLPDHLHVYSGDGVEVVKTVAPVGFQFYYLSEYTGLGASIVCVAETPIDGWRDWYFGFDLKSKKLFRHGPAY